MTKNNNSFHIENSKINGLPVVRIEDTDGRYQGLRHWKVEDEHGNILLETKEFGRSANCTYFGRESSKKDALLLGYCEIAEGKRASGYAKNERVGSWFRMSAYLYKWEGDTLLRTTCDSGAANGRIDVAQPVATKKGNVITMLKKTPKTGKKVQTGQGRTDSGKAHGKDNSARGALEKVRRA